MKFLARTLYFLGLLLAPACVFADALDQWMTRTSPVPVSLFDITYAKGLFVAVGTDINTGIPRLIVSSNGVDWLRFASFARFSPRAITYGSNGLFVAVGDADQYDVADTPGVIVSTNGTNWAYLQNFGNAFTKTNFYGIAYTQGLFVAVGQNGAAVTSYDGSNWVSHGLPTQTTLTTVAYGNGLWLASGPREADGGTIPPDQGPLLISTNGTNWTLINSAFNAARILYAHGRFTAIAGDNFTTNASPMRYSFDGTNWTDIAEPATDLLRNITYGGGLYTAVGRNVIKTSLDGTNWVRRYPANSDVTNRLRAVAYGANIFVAVGDVILQSEDIRPRVDIVPSNGNDFNLWDFTISGLSNALYQLSSSTNLADWTPGMILRVTNSPQTVFGLSPVVPHRFFQATAVPE